MPIGNFLEDKDLKFENVGDVCVMIYISVQGGIIVWQLTDQFFKDIICKYKFIVECKLMKYSFPPQISA